MHELREELGLWKLRLFDPAGKVIFSTQPEEIGLQVSEPYFFQQVAQGFAPELRTAPDPSAANPALPT